MQRFPGRRSRVAFWEPRKLITSNSECWLWLSVKQTGWMMNGQRAPWVLDQAGCPEPADLTSLAAAQPTGRTVYSRSTWWTSRVSFLTFLSWSTSHSFCNLLTLCHRRRSSQKDSVSNSEHKIHEKTLQLLPVCYCSTTQIIQYNYLYLQNLIKNNFLKKEIFWFWIKQYGFCKMSELVRKVIIYRYCHYQCRFGQKMNKN